MMMQSKKSGGSPTPVGYVGIACWINGERRYFTEADWDEKYLTDVIGVYVNTENTHVIIHPLRTTKLNWGVGLKCPNVTTTNVEAEAKNDFNGLKNTADVLAAYDEGKYADCGLFLEARAMTFVDGTPAYIPASGELFEIFENAANIDRCRQLVGSSPFAGDSMSSTQYSATDAWSSSKNYPIRHLNKSGRYAYVVCQI